MQDKLIQKKKVKSKSRRLQKTKQHTSKSKPQKNLAINKKQQKNTKLHSQPYIQNLYFVRTNKLKSKSNKKLKSIQINSINYPNQLNKKLSQATLSSKPTLNITQKYQKIPTETTQTQKTCTQLKQSLKKLINPKKLKRNSQKLITSSYGVSMNQIWGSSRNINYESRGSSLDANQYEASIQLQSISKKISNESVKDSYKQLECCQKYLKNIEIGNKQQQIQQILKDLIKEEYDKILINIYNFNLSKKLRYYTLDWIFSLSQQINLNRQTTYLAIHYFDKYLSNHSLKMYQIQLLAITVVTLAYKLQQNAPQDFLQIFPKQFEKATIIQMEKKVVIAFQYKLRLNTFIFWLDCLTNAWDKYVQQSRILSFNIIQENIGLIIRSLKFRDTRNMQMMANLIQLLDTAIYDLSIYNFSRPKLILSAIYLISRIQIEYMIQEDERKYRVYYEKYKKSSNALFVDKYDFNQLFSQFLFEYGLELCDLIQTHKFLAQFLDIQFVVIDQDPFNFKLDQILTLQNYNRTTFFYFNSKF